jgi:hypothetical protein
MSRRRWSALLLSAVLAATVSAGELKLHCWPAGFIPVDVVHIGVVMDIGYWMNLVNPPDTVKLQQLDYCTYEGCLDLKVMCNFNLAMQCTVDPTGAVPGQYTCRMEGSHIISPPGGTARVFVRLENANVSGVWANSKDVQVATLTIRITPWV